MINYIKGLILLIVVASNSLALACKPGGLQEYIEFEENNSEIGATKARNLALWFIDWRDIRGISYVTVFSNSKKNDEKTKRLSDERLEKISTLLSPLAKNSVKIEYINTPIQPKSKQSEKYFLNTIEISIQPKCAETESCCGGGGRR
jgi:hypothetical protein